MRKFRFFATFLLFLCNQFLFAQAATPPVEMADGMRSNGKIYVVVGVVVIILFGLITYLISIDRKITKIEKEINENKTNNLATKTPSH